MTSGTKYVFTYRLPALFVAFVEYYGHKYGKENLTIIRGMLRRVVLGLGTARGRVFMQHVQSVILPDYSEEQQATIREQAQEFSTKLPG